MNKSNSTALLCSAQLNAVDTALIGLTCC